MGMPAGLRANLSQTVDCHPAAGLVGVLQRADEERHDMLGAPANLGARDGGL